MDFYLSLIAINAIGNAIVSAIYDNDITFDLKSRIEMLLNNLQCLKIHSLAQVI